MRCGACSSNASTVAGFVTSTTWNSVSSRSGVASTRTSLTEQFDSGMFVYARVSVQTAATLSTNYNWCFCVRSAKATFPYWKFLFFWVPFLKQLLLKNCAVDFVETCNVHVGKMIIKATKRIFNSDKIYRSYDDLNFGVTFLEHSVFISLLAQLVKYDVITTRKIKSIHAIFYHILLFYITKINVSPTPYI